MMTMMYILPMLLGRTFDIKTNRVGVDIFNQEDVNNPSIVREHNLKSEYRRVRDVSESHKLLDISGELSLKIKSGMVKIGGSGAYLKENENRRDVVEILTVMTFITVSKSLQKKAVPIPGWDKFLPRDLGTHYVSGITYGGRLLASLKFQATDDKHIESIKAAIDGALQAGSAFDLEAVGKLDKLQKDLQGHASLEITYYATVPLKGVAQTMEGLRDLVNGFQNHVQEVNDGIGVPIQVELTELSSLNSQFQFNKYLGLDNRLKVVELQFDDLLQVQDSIKRWLKNRGSILKEDQEKEIDEYYTEILWAIAIFKEDINNLDIEKGPEQLDRITKSYKMSDGSSIPGKHRRKWDRMQKQLVSTDLEKDKTLAGTSGNSVYVRWGKTKCNETRAETLYNGYVATTTTQGSPSMAICLPEKPQFLESENQRKSKIAGVRYGVVHLNPFLDSPSLFDTAVTCSVCYAEGRNSLIDLPTNQCPEGWSMEYKGYYLSGKNEAPKSEAVCVDNSPEHFKLATGDYKTEQYILAITHNKKAVPCIVCSK